MKQETKTNLPAVIAPANVPALQKDRPNYLAAGGRGLENVERRDIVLPRLAVCQSMTPQRKASSPSFIKGLEEGGFFNSLTGEIYQMILQFIPILIFKSRLYFRPMEDGGGMLCQSPNGKTGGSLSPTCDVCPHSQWGKLGEHPDCTLLYNYAGVIRNTRELIVVSLKTTGIKIAKQWNAIMRLRNADSFAGVYELSTTPQKNNMGEWHTLVVRPAGWTDQLTFNHCETLYASLQEANVQVDATGLDEDDEVAQGQASF